MIPSLRQLSGLAEKLLLGERVVFHHLPKCGGTSIRKALRNSYPFSYAAYGSDPAYRTFETLHPDQTLDQLAVTVTEFRQVQLLYFLYRDFKCISGLCPFSNIAYSNFGNKYKFVTTIREPVSLMTSIYNYDRYMSRDRWRTELPIEAYLETPRAARFGAIYSEFYSGLPPTSDPFAAEAIAAAKLNLLKFTVVGFVEDMAGFQRRLRSALNTRIRIGRHNVARTNAIERSKSLALELRQKIEDLSRVNIEIYDYVVKNRM
jgi:hypothetical protein